MLLIQNEHDQIILNPVILREKQRRKMNYMKEEDQEFNENYGRLNLFIDLEKDNSKKSRYSEGSFEKSHRVKI